MPPVALVPIRGIAVADSSTHVEIGLYWNILSVQQVKSLAVRYDPSGSLHGNLAMIEDRLAPDSYLLVKCEVPDSSGYVQAYDNGESILAALCISVLLDASLWPDALHQQAAPLYRARFKEACELPLVFDEERVRLVGHSSWFSWLSPWNGTPPRISRQGLQTAVEKAPSVVGKILEEDGPLTGADRLLRSSLRAMHSALQATTPGQLTANLVSAAELLVSGQDREQWFRRKARLKVAVGWASWSRCEDILSARHAFVHEAIQPADSFMGHCALALFVQIWVVFAKLFARFGEQTAALVYLDRLVAETSPGNRRTSDIEQEELARLEVISCDVPQGPVRTMKWVHQYLADGHPNDYHKRYVVSAKSCCDGPQCGGLLVQNQVVAREPGIQVFRCRVCGHITRAALVSPEISQVTD